MPRRSRAWRVRRGWKSRIEQFIPNMHDERDRWHSFVAYVQSLLFPYECSTLSLWPQNGPTLLGKRSLVLSMPATLMIASTSWASRNPGRFLGRSSGPLGMSAPRTSSSCHPLGCHVAAAPLQEVLRVVLANPGFLVQFKEGAQLWGSAQMQEMPLFSCMAYDTR